MKEVYSRKDVEIIEKEGDPEKIRKSKERAIKREQKEKDLYIN